MVKELLKLGYIKEKVYKDIPSLIEELKNEIDRVIERKKFQKL
jgi:DNA replication initiation complex subunit (GINS family)